MNLPNKLTVLRVLLVPVFIIFIYADAIPFNYLTAAIIFIAASVTDWMDGMIARSRNLVTTFGKFLDPLADKILVISALCVFVDNPAIDMSAVPLIIIITREFVVSGMRLLAMEDGVVIAAGIWGKLKTAFTMVTIVIILVYMVVFYDFGFNIDQVQTFIRIWVLEVLIWISTALTIISGAVYLKNGWKYVAKTK
ncbi:MAG: CDP-diacylglycerol--glycerol-3-phosphate 3-phosphatidyltransferase [Ruminococcus sp.]|nr:CDP-diacylglycerol--glycerol-3-phosphate 3-phosphatidyltransferase [Ruminococcus sp.]